MKQALKYVQYLLLSYLVFRRGVRKDASPKGRRGMAGMHQPRHPDDCGHEEDRGEEEQRMRHVERRVVVMRGDVVLRTVLDVVRWVKERRSEHQDGGSDHQQPEADSLGMGRNNNVHETLTQWVAFKQFHHKRGKLLRAKWL
jgi:hypothetical protein